MKVHSMLRYVFGIAAVTMLASPMSLLADDDSPKSGSGSERESRDAEPRDGDRPKGDSPEARRRDGDRPDGGRPDGGRPDGGRPDGGRPDGGRPDDVRPGIGRPEGNRPGAGRPGFGRPEGDRPGMFMAGPPVMVALDRDRDGKLSSEEIDMAIVSLKTLDHNGDGELTREELFPPMRDGDRPGPGGPGFGGPRDGGPRDGDRPEMRDRGAGFDGQRPSPEQLIKLMDKNGDGALDRDEAPERMAQFFDRADTSGDGKLDAAEMKVVAERMMQGGGRRADNDQPDGPVKPRRPEQE